MSEPLKAVLTTERMPSGQYQWVITAIDTTVGTMPQTQRSTQLFATEEEAKRAGAQALEDFELQKSPQSRAG